MKKIVIIGDMMLDEYVTGSVTRISPEAPVPIFKCAKKDFVLGGSANVALNCKRAGCQVFPIGVIGDDSAGEKILSLFYDHSIASDGLVLCKNRKTTNKKRIVSQNQQLFRIDLENTDPISSQNRRKLIEKIENAIDSDYIVLISDYSKGVIDKGIVEKITSKAKEKKVPVIVDPKGPTFEKYRGVNFLKPNLKEFSEMITYSSLIS